MTEEEAKTKFCPVNSLLGAEELDGRHRTGCIASACMAWRTTEAVLRPDPTPVGDAPTWAQTGYCGLAGAPQ